MRLWIDNTGLQSAALCLEGRAASGYDVRGLLQLATLIVFGESISLNGFEDNSIADRSHLVVQHLEDLGVRSIVSIRPVSEQDYQRACRSTAELAAVDLKNLVLTAVPASWISGEPPDLPRGIIERQSRYMDLAEEREGSARLQEVEATALKDKAVGAIEYMMACSPPLRQAIAALRKSRSFNNHNIYDLNIALRYYLNEALSEQTSAWYAPAVGRAERLNRSTADIFQSLNAEVDKAANDMRERLQLGPLGIPSISTTLLQRSKGEPRSVLKVALELRQRTDELRGILQELASKFPGGTPESRFELQNFIAQLGQQLRRDLRLEPSAALFDAIQIAFIAGFPVPTIKLGELAKWIEQVQLRRRAAVLTEMVKASAFADGSPSLFEKLQNQSMAR